MAVRPHPYFRHLHVALALAISLGSASVCVAAPPGNDGFSGATILGPALPSTKTGNALEATLQTSEVILDSSLWNGSLWFKWTPTAAGTGFAAPTFTWTADGNGDINGFDHEIIVYSGTTLTGLIPVARGSETTPIERFLFSTGQTYYFQIHVSTGPESATFPYSMTLASTTAAPAAPGNDASASATIITGTPTAATPIIGTGTTASATLQSGESADSPTTRTVWFKYTTGPTPASPTRQFSLFSTRDDSYQVLEIFTDSSVDSLTRLARVEDYGASLVPLTANTTYYLRVSNDDSGSVAGAFEIEIATQPGAAVPIPPNNAFASATDLGSSLDTPTASTTVKSSLETGEKNPFATRGTVWFKWTAPAAGWYAVSALSDDWPPALAVWSGTALTNLKLRSATDSYTANTIFQATTGEVFYFQAVEEGGYANPFEISVSATTNPEQPRLASLTLSPSSVNVTTSAQSVTATLALSGPADGFIDSVYLLHPNGGIAAFAFSEDFTQTSGTPGNGTFTTTLSVPGGVAAGTYPLLVYLSNDLGDYFTYGSTSLITPQSPTWTWQNYSDVPSGTDALTVTNTVTADTAPSLTSFTVTPPTADMGTAAATFNISAVLADTQGVASASVEWNDPSGNLPGETIDLTLSGGISTNGTWTGSFDIPRYTAAGRLNLTLRYEDTVGQSKRHGIQPGVGALLDRFEGRLATMNNATVTLTNSVGTDYIPPQASEVTVTPNPATFALGGTTSVTVSARVKDALSGTASVEVSLGGFTTATLPRMSGGTASDGVYSGVLNVDRLEYTPGAYSLFLLSTDESGNTSTFTSTAPDIPNVTLNVLPDGYDAWTITNSLLAPDDEPLAEPQQDGINNALKFASNLNPAIAITGAQRVLDPISGTSGLPAIRQVGSGATTRLRVTFLHRLSTPGLVQVVEFCSDPSATGPSGWTPASGPETIEPIINTQWQRVTVDDVQGAGQPVRFGRLRVEVTR